MNPSMSIAWLPPESGNKYFLLFAVAIVEYFFRFREVSVWLNPRLALLRDHKD